MKKVLIIEDDVLWAELLAGYVNRAGAQPQVVASGALAIDVIDEWQPDLLVLDMLLAGETGVALLNELRSHEDLARLPVLVCSSVNLTEAELRPYGVSVVLDKARMSPGEAVSAIRELLA